MAQTRIQECSICGTEYEVCPYCPRTVQYTPWRAVCCCERHFVLHTAISAFVCGVTNKDELAAELVKFKVTEAEIAEMKPEIRKIVEDVLGSKAEEKKPEKVQKKK